MRHLLMSRDRAMRRLNEVIVWLTLPLRAVTISKEVQGGARRSWATLLSTRTDFVGESFFSWAISPFSATPGGQTNEQLLETTQYFELL
jgi:hypothetical protein